MCASIWSITGADKPSMVELVVGRIGKPHGIRCEDTVEVRTDAPEVRFAAGAVLRTEPAATGPLTVEHAHWHSGRLLLSFAGVRDRCAAEALRNVLVVVSVAADESTGDDEEFYDHQLLGLRVLALDGTAIGDVTAVLHLPAQDVLVVRRTRGAEVLIPFVAQIVPEVDLTGGFVRVNPPPGLLELDDPDPDPPAAVPS
ncbi:MAG: ribosome maturation factor RimM [Sporichthyaceae bacterium]